jgi:PAS domain-containing protein
VAHVELSVTDPFVAPRAGGSPAALSSLDRWGVAAQHATEACLVLDALQQVVAASPAACELLGLGDPAAAAGKSVFAGVLRLVDFTAASADLGDGELEKIPPVLAFSSRRLARGLMRVQNAMGTVTIDAIATPLFDGATVVGSLTFLASI